MNSLGWTSTAAIAIIAATCVVAIELYVRKMNKRLAEESDRDPYIDQVRAMRNLPGCQKDVAVSIQDQHTGEFYYYPRGSETRVRRDPVSLRLISNGKHLTNTED